MTELITQTARLIPYTKRPRQGAGFVTAYLHEPAPDDPAAKFGNLYVAIEVLISGRTSEEVADLVIETFGNAYYNESRDQPFPLARFEHGVKQINQALAGQVDRGNAAWIGKLSCVIAVVADGEVHITHTGSAEAFLYRGQAHTRITNNQPQNQPTPTKTFGSIASGELEPGDRLLFSTPALIHNVPLTKLASAIRQSAPSGAISELTSLLKDATTERVAAIITEITTPERAAMALRTDDPSEIQLGAPKTSLQAAKMAAAPLATGALNSSRTLISRSHDLGKILAPLGKVAGLKVAAAIRHVLGTSLGRRAAAGIAVLLIIASGLGLWNQQRSNQQDQLFQSYQQVYQQFLGVDTTNGQTALVQLNDISAKLAKFKSNEQAINQLLTNRHLLDGEPTTLQAFHNQLDQAVNELSGISTVEPTPIAKLNTASQTPSFVELASGKLYVFGVGAKPTLQIINPATSAVTASRASLASIGAITATTLAPAGDGIFILTNKPGVWHYKFATDTVTEQTVSYGTWTNGKALGAYATNLYILGGTTVDKFVRSGTGYTPRVQYAQLPTATTTPAAMAIDGSVYVLGQNQLIRYLSGVINQTVPLPQPVSGLTNLRVASGGKLLTATSPTTKRIVMFAISNGSISYDRQLSVVKAPTLTDSVYDSRSGLMYAIAGDQIVSVTAGRR